MSGVIRRAADMRRIIIISLVYPSSVLVVAYILLSFSVLKTIPVMIRAYQEFAEPSLGLSILQWIASTGPHWLPWLPPAILALAVLLWYRSRRAWSLHSTAAVPGRRRGRARYPTTANVMHNGRMSTFSDTLALLLEHEVPLHESLPLAADACGDPGLRVACLRQADRIGRGESSVAADMVEAPPILAWLLTEVRDEKILISALRRLAESYRRHAKWMVRWLSLYLPILLMAVIGGTIVCAYGLIVIGPWARLLYELSLP
jgi:type II secretory pathway component PulF